MANKKLLALLAFFTFSANLYSQITDDELWTKRDANLKSASSDILPTLATPSKFDLYNLNLPLLVEKLRNVGSRDEAPKKSDVIISFPNIKGDLENFGVLEASVMEPDLQRRFPKIRSYVGKGINNPGSIIRFSVSPLGLNSIQLSKADTTVIIDPYTKDRSVYMVYSGIETAGLGSYLGKDIVDSGLIKKNKDLKSGEILISSDGKLRTFRLALTSTGENSQDILTTQGIPNNSTNEIKKATILSSLNSLLTTVNAEYERDVCLTMKLVANNTDIIFLDPNTDNLTDSDAGKLLGENQTICDQIVGKSNYDIGHVLASQFSDIHLGGLGGLGVVCGSSKAHGVSSHLSYRTIIHEIGHQFGADHTFNYCDNSDYSSFSSVEPGCGRTWMSYGSGVNNFHSVSIQQIWKVITNNCPNVSQSNTGNKIPIAIAGNDITIPKSTPFILDGQGSDDNMNLLSYSWEQNDTTIIQYPPITTAIDGPVFKCNPPSLSPIRYMPELKTVLSGNLNLNDEAVPSVSRKLNFNFVVRDNDVRGGQIAIAKKTVTIDGNSGPFLVTSHKSPETWYAGLTKTILWDVAGTNTGLVNVQNVDILFSTDGGYTYPTKLASIVPNDGEQDIIVPQGLKTETGRYMVCAVGNSFFSVNGANLIIEEVPFLMNFSSKTIDVCLPVSTGNYVFIYNALIGYNGTTTFSANTPIGIVANFDPISANKDGVSVKIAISGIGNSNLGNNKITITGTSSGSPAVLRTEDVYLNVYKSTFTPLTLISPVNGALNVPPPIILKWKQDLNAITYTIEIATDNSFNNVIETASTSINEYSPKLLKINSTYYWRVAPKNPFANGVFSSIFSFKTLDINQLTYIPDNNFQQALRDLGIDKGYLNNYVLTSDIKYITILDIQKRHISDLTGIQDFTGLTWIRCSDNNLTAIDISKNLELTNLYIDINQLKLLDVSKNSKLSYLICSYNQIVDLDLSKNKNLKYFECRGDGLQHLNLRNGKNENLQSIDVWWNPIACIQVDNPIAASINTNWKKEEKTIYSEDCNNIFVPAPKISSISSNPYCLKELNTTFNIYGDNFNYVSSVQFGGVEAVFTIWSNTQIQVNSMYLASGDISVTSIGGTATLAGFKIMNLPNTPGKIDGTTSVCQGQSSLKYTVPLDANATSYIWTLPTGATGTSTTNSITVNYSTSAISGNITVKGHNTCGDGTVSALPIIVNPLPLGEGKITGAVTVCKGQGPVTYSVSTIPNANSYLWTLPQGVTGTSTSSSITVNYGTSTNSGNITVKGHNDCGDGAVSSLAVTVNPIPVAPTIVQKGTYLHSDAPTGNQWYDQNGLIVSATAQDYNITSLGDYSLKVILNGCSSTSSTISIKDFTTAIEQYDNSKKIVIYPNPVSDDLTIKYEGNLKEIKFEIYNSVGQVVTTGVLLETAVVHTSMLSSGVYTIKFNTGKTFDFKKVIKHN